MHLFDELFIISGCTPVGTPVNGTPPSSFDAGQSPGFYKKKDETEINFFPGSKKKSKKVKSERKMSMNKSLSHNTETFRQFGLVKLDPPSCLAEVKTLIELLRAKLKLFKKLGDEEKMKREDICEPSNPEVPTLLITIEPYLDTPPCNKTNLKLNLQISTFQPLLGENTRNCDFILDSHNTIEEEKNGQTDKKVNEMNDHEDKKANDMNDHEKKKVNEINDYEKKVNEMNDHYEKKVNSMNAHDEKKVNEMNDHEEKKLNEINDHEEMKVIDMNDHEEMKVIEVNDHEKKFNEINHHEEMKVIDMNDHEEMKVNEMNDHEEKKFNEINDHEEMKVIEMNDHEEKKVNEMIDHEEKKVNEMNDHEEKKVNEMNDIEEKKDDEEHNSRVQNSNEDIESPFPLGSDSQPSFL